MRIIVAAPSQASDWDRYVHGHGRATAYHLMAWLLAIEEAYGFRIFPLIAVGEDNNVLGVLPLALLKVPLGKCELVGVPYCDVGTVLADNPEVERELLKEAVALSREFGATTLELRGETDEAALKSTGLPWTTSQAKVRMLLELPQDSETLWKGFKSKLRSQVNKAKKNGLTFAWGSDRLDDFYTVFCRNMRDLGSPVHSRTWFDCLVRLFGDHCQVGVVYKDATPIGGGIILQAAKTVSIPWASTLREHNRLGPNMLLYWNCLEFAADHGAAFFDFGRSTPDEGTYRFKGQWGARPQPLTWHSISLDGRTRGAAGPPSAKRQLAEKVWQKLPLGVVNGLGPFLRKYISL